MLVAGAKRGMTRHIPILTAPCAVRPVLTQSCRRARTRRIARQTPGNWSIARVQGTDGGSVVNWAAKLPHANGDVGLLGASYMGIDQFATAADAGPAHVKAMFPIIAGNDLYRDTAFAGGFPDIEFDALYLGLTATLNLFQPVYEGNSNLANALVDHVRDLLDFDTSLLLNVELGGDNAYDQTYWGARNPGQYIQKIVADGIPAFLVGGWYDLFQRGELLSPGTQNDTTAPFTKPTTLAGPIGADAVRELDDIRFRVGRPALRRRPGRHGTTADLRTTRGRSACAGPFHDVVRPRRQSAAALPPVHEGSPVSGRSGRPHALRRRGLPDVSTRSRPATGCG